MGCIGEQNPLFHYHGKMKGVRISRSERYSTDFQPEEQFSPDRTTILIYAADAVSDGTVRDLSGHGNDGRVERF